MSDERSEFAALHELIEQQPESRRTAVYADALISLAVKHMTVEQVERGTGLEDMLRAWGLWLIGQAQPGYCDRFRQVLDYINLEREIYVRPGQDCTPIASKSLNKQKEEVK